MGGQGEEREREEEEEEGSRYGMVRVPRGKERGRFECKGCGCSEVPIALTLLSLHLQQSRDPSNPPKASNLSLLQPSLQSFVDSFPP